MDRWIKPQYFFFLSMRSNVRGYFKKMKNWMIKNRGGVSGCFTDMLSGPKWNYN